MTDDDDLPGLSVYREAGREARRNGAPRPQSLPTSEDDFAQREAFVQGWLAEDAYIRTRSNNQPKDRK